jgi:sugar-specific transcriptional regulator TrmB
VDADAAASPDEVLERVRDALEEAARQAEGRLLATRVTLTGRTKVHRTLERQLEQYVNEIRACASAVVSAEVWIEKVAIQTRAALDLAELAHRNDAIGQLCQAIDALRDDDEELVRLVEQIGDLKSKLFDVRRDGTRFEFETPEGRRRLLDEAEQILLPRLLEDEEGA